MEGKIFDIYLGSEMTEISKGLDMGVRGKKGLNTTARDLA